MRTLELGETFGLIIVPGHSFQFMLTPEAQVKVLETFKYHLEPGGILVIHLDHQSLDVRTLHTNCDSYQKVGRDRQREFCHSNMGTEAHGSALCLSI